MRILKLLFVYLILFLSIKTEAQSGFKQEKHQFNNFVGGYQFMPGNSKLNDRLSLNGFPDLLSPQFIFGFEYGVVYKKRIVKMKFSATGIFVGKSSKYSLVRTSDICFKYGHDILPKSERTYLYPFVGYNLIFRNLLATNSKDSTGFSQKLDATKIDFDLVTGLGLKQFFKKDFIGFLTNVDINAGISIPVITDKWRNTGSQFLYGMYRLQSVFDFTASLGF